jgi:hypothetical protein
VRFDAIVNLDGFNEVALSRPTRPRTTRSSPAAHYLLMLNLGRDGGRRAIEPPVIGAAQGEHWARPQTAGISGVRSSRARCSGAPS